MSPTVNLPRVRTFFAGKPDLQLGIVHVPGNGLHRSDGLQFLQHGKLDNIPGMQNEIDVLEYLEDRGRQRRRRAGHMGIGDDADFHENTFKRWSLPQRETDLN